MNLLHRPHETKYQTVVDQALSYLYNLTHAQT